MASLPLEGSPAAFPLGRPALFRNARPRDAARADVSLPARLHHQRPGLALLVEMPGVEAVAMGLALAAAGYRPVPVFNGSPPPIKPRHPRVPSPVSPAVVDVESVLAAIVGGADTLRNLKILPTAPPAF